MADDPTPREPDEPAGPPPVISDDVDAAPDAQPTGVPEDARQP